MVRLLVDYVNLKIDELPPKYEPSDKEVATSPFLVTMSTIPSCMKYILVPIVPSVKNKQKYILVPIVPSVKTNKKDI